MDKELYLLRGCPGAGKSLIANKLTVYAYAADDFFMKNGHYHFNPDLLGAAHQDCQQRVEDAMKVGISPIAVHNTLTTEKELKPYLDLAEKYGYMSHSLIVERRHSGENQHEVPPSVIEKMKNRFSVKL